MKSELVNKLRLSCDPVAVFFTDDKPENALEFKSGVRGCVASMLYTCASKGKTTVFDENTYGCPGGGVGLCFGNAFEKNNHPTEYLLSGGDEALAADGKTLDRSLGRGERFFESPELVAKWKANVPYTETGKKYVVFRPLSDVREDERPDLIFMYANPDQISALVIMSGAGRGKALNVLAPFAAACQSIVLAYQEIGKEQPNAIMGYFDISQRDRIPKELLSFTVTYDMFCELERGVPTSCLTTEAWEKIEGRQ